MRNDEMDTLTLANHDDDSSTSSSNSTRLSGKTIILFYCALHCLQISIVGRVIFSKFSITVLLAVLLYISIVDIQLWRHHQLEARVGPTGIALINVHLHLPAKDGEHAEVRENAGVSNSGTSPTLAQFQGVLRLHPVLLIRNWCQWGFFLPVGRSRSQSLTRSQFRWLPTR